VRASVEEQKKKTVVTAGIRYFSCPKRTSRLALGPQSDINNTKGKGKGYLTTGHEGPELE